jgi:hypothetical protein
VWIPIGLYNNFRRAGPCSARNIKKSSEDIAKRSHDLWGVNVPKPLKQGFALKNATTTACLLNQGTEARQCDQVLQGQRQLNVPRYQISHNSLKSGNRWLGSVMSTNET